MTYKELKDFGYLTPHRNTLSSNLSPKKVEQADLQKGECPGFSGVALTGQTGWYLGEETPTLRKMLD